MARKPKVAPPSNVTDETIAEYAAKIRSADLDLEEAHVVYKGAVGVRRGIVKAAIAAGVPTDALLQTLKDAKQDKQKVLDLIRDRARCAAILQLPTGHQFGLLEGDELPDTDPTLVRRVKVTRAQQEGMEAGRKLRDREDNHYEAGTEEYAAWDEAWMDGNQAAHAKKDKPKPVRATKAAVGSDGPEMGGAAEGEETWMCGLRMEHVGTRVDDDYLEKMRDMGLKAFADGKKLEDMPKNMAPACVAHWQFGYSQGASMGESITGTKAA